MEVKSGVNRIDLHKRVIESHHIYKAEIVMITVVDGVRNREKKNQLQHQQREKKKKSNGIIIIRYRSHWRHVCIRMADVFMYMLTSVLFATDKSYCNQR